MGIVTLYVIYLYGTTKLHMEMARVARWVKKHVSLPLEAIVCLLCLTAINIGSLNHDHHL